MKKYSVFRRRYSLSRSKNFPFLNIVKGCTNCIYEYHTDGHTSPSPETSMFATHIYKNKFQFFTRSCHFFLKIVLSREEVFRNQFQIRKNFIPVISKRSTRFNVNRLNYTLSSYRIYIYIWIQKHIMQIQKLEIRRRGIRWVLVELLAFLFHIP